MSAPNQYGRGSDEMFFNRQGTPAVEPLRINKRDSGASAAPSTQSGRIHAASPPPGSYRGASPLPYPDDQYQYPHPQGATGSQPPYPEDTSRIVTPDMGRTASPNYGYPPPRAASASSGSFQPAEYPQVLRPSDGKGKSTLAERRGNGPKPLPDSPGPDLPDKEGLFQKQPQRPAAASSGSSSNSYAGYNFPPPGGSAAAKLDLPDATSRIDRNPSTSTTKAYRGSPPPPETPIIPPGHRPTSEIEARFAAAGIAGTGTLTGLQAQSAAAQQRAHQYANQQQQQQPPPHEPQAQSVEQRRPWTPTEQPGGQHAPTAVYQGPGQAVPQQSNTTSPPHVPSQPTGPHGQATAGQQSGPGQVPQHLENDMQRLSVSDEPPPAYASIAGSAPNPHYTGEKHRLNTGGPAAGPGATPSAIQPVNAAPVAHPDHPAFANDHSTAAAAGPSQPQMNGVGQVLGQQPQQHQQNAQQPQQATVHQPNANLAPPASPPPLPEGWIAHLDSNSGQYYYIHLPTQSTQWEFPKGPTPLNLNETPMSPLATGYNNPLSPGLSSFGKPMASPGMPMSPTYETASVMNLGSTLGSPAAFTGPPPSSGVDLYKVAPTNGVYFGPYLRYTNMDLERGIWLGSILLVTDAPQPPTIHIHQSVDLSPNPRQLKAHNIAKHQRWTFYKYEVDLQMDESAAKWTYAITSHLGCTRYEFLVAGRHETGWRFIATSGNDFTLSVSANERQRIGGIGYVWKDIMQKHAECGGFHVQIGLGGQINADRLWKEIPSLKQWLAMSGKEARKNAGWTAAHEEDVSHAYFHYYTSHFDHPYLREAFAQIPHILTLDDHDM